MTDINFDKIFDQFNITERVEKSMKEYTNWLLGISIGLVAILQSRAYTENCFSILSIIILIIITGGIFFIGYTKYLIFNREIQINTKFGELKKLHLLNIGKEIDNSTKENAQKILENYYKESNKLESISRFINIGTFLTALNILLTVVFILIIMTNLSCI
jgi:hypothetical protein